jgi:hypothetical protein
MAKQTITTIEYTDDLDGGKADGTIIFAWDGVNYEIDLSKRNAREFEKTMAIYVGHARRVRSNGARRRGGAGKRDLSAIRAWAAANGHKMAPRGRISGDVVAAYEAAN